MVDQDNYFNIDYPGYSPLEVSLKDPEDFLKVRETLSRIGVASKKEKVLCKWFQIVYPLPCSRPIEESQLSDRPARDRPETPFRHVLRDLALRATSADPPGWR